VGGDDLKNFLRGANTKKKKKMRQRSGEIACAERGRGLGGDGVAAINVS
jgi:hypothetical protein